MNKVPGVDMTTGSPGQELPVGVCMALGAKAGIGKLRQVGLKDTFAEPGEYYELLKIRNGRQLYCQNGAGDLFIIYTSIDFLKQGVL